VVVAITPWNSPLMILTWKLGPALAAGNTVVVKPSELASASTLEFAAMLHEAGLPAGVLNVVTGYGNEVGEALVRHRLTRKVSFTGSDFGGRKVAEAAAAGVVPATLELGGKSAQIVFADADIDNAVNGVLSGIFLSNGQTCVAGSRLIVEAPLKDAFVARIIERAKALKPGDPMDPATRLGPLANAQHFEKVSRMIARAKEAGAACLLDGTALTGTRAGFYIGPTVFDNVTPDMQLWREEVFGPVLAVTAFDTEEQAVALANDTDYGLAGGVWTSDPARGARVAGRIEAGTVYVNHYRSVDPNAPIGGLKHSGYGRELGPDAVKDFLQTKSVWIGRAPVADPFPADEPIGGKE
jgi:aldehyde dehydrogenase (NAD+)